MPDVSMEVIVKNTIVFLDELTKKEKLANDEEYKEFLSDEERKRLGVIIKDFLPLAKKSQNVEVVGIYHLAKRINDADEYWKEHYVMPENWETDIHG